MIRRGKRRSPAVRLFCLPYAGAGASIFRDWPDLFPPEIEVATIQLPGREDRQLEPPLTALEPLVRTVTVALRPYLSTPMAFFGHCAGALLAFEVALECRRRFAVSPRHLFVSGQGAPHLPAKNAPIHALPDDQFWAELRRLEGAPAEVLDNDGLKELLQPCLRADFSLWERYEYRDRAPLSCPITAFAGEDDERTVLADVGEWDQHTKADFALRTLPGGHFFLNDRPDDLVRDMVARLR